jgi:hypothetical protein
LNGKICFPIGKSLVHNDIPTLGNNGGAWWFHAGDECWPKTTIWLGFLQITP